MAAELINAVVRYRFMQYAVVACILISVACGLIGVIITEKKMLMMAGGIAHTAFGGIGLGFLAGFDPLLGAFLFALMAAFGIGCIKRRRKTQADIPVALFWSAGMAAGILFIAVMPGYPPDISSYLFGSILTLTTKDLVITAVAAAAVILVVTSLFSYWKSFLFDEEFAEVTGIKTAVMDYLMLALISVTVVAVIRAAGIILALTLLAAPAAIAGMFTVRLRARMVGAVLAGIVITSAGLAISYAADMPSGASIALLAAAGYFAVWAGFGILRKARYRKAGRN